MLVTDPNLTTSLLFHSNKTTTTMQNSFALQLQVKLDQLTQASTAYCTHLSPSPSPSPKMSLTPSSNSSRYPSPLAQHLSSPPASNPSSIRSIPRSRQSVRPKPRQKRCSKITKPQRRIHQMVTRSMRRREGKPD